MERTQLRLKTEIFDLFLDRNDLWVKMFLTTTVMPKIRKLNLGQLSIYTTKKPSGMSLKLNVQMPG